MGTTRETDIRLALIRITGYGVVVTVKWLCGCSVQHRSNRAFVKCALDSRDVTLLGDGRYAFVSFCDQGDPNVKYGNKAYVRLYARNASLIRRIIEDNVKGCCKSCNGPDHHLAKLIPVLRYPASRTKV